MRESEIEDYLCRRVRAMGGDVRKVRFLDVNGAPDRLVMLPNWPRSSIWVELKATGEHAKPHQIEQHRAMQALGQAVVVINSLEGVDRLLA